MYLCVYIICALLLIYKSKREAINKSWKWRIKLILGTKLAALIGLIPSTALVFIPFPFGELAVFGVLAGLEELAEGTTPAAVEFEVKTTTIQLSSEPIPMPVNLGSLREFEYWECLRSERALLGTELGTQTGSTRPLETFKLHLAKSSV